LFDLAKSGKWIVRNDSSISLKCSQFGWTKVDGSKNLPVCKKGNEFEKKLKS